MVYFFYYIPIGLDIAFKKRPFITYFICCVSVILLLLFKYRPFGAWWDLSRLTFQPLAPTIATAITHAFLHGGWFHLIGNIVYLLVFGRPLEDRLGSLKFYVVFAASAAAGVYLHLVLTALYSPQYLTYGIVGASGATSGILGAYMIRLYFSRVRVAYWIFMPLQGVNRAGRTYLPVVSAVIFWFVLQGVRTVLQYGTGGMQIAYSVHLGGFAAGALLALCFGALPEARAENHLVRARRHFEEASWFAAQAEYIDYLALRAAEPQAHVELARTFICGGDAVRARSHYIDAVRLVLDRGERDAAETLFGEAMRHIPNFALSEELHLDLACGMERTLKFQSAMHAYEHFVWRYPFSKEAPFVLLRMAGIFEKRFSRPEAAYCCYRRLTDEYSSDQWAGYAREAIARLERDDPVISLIDNK